MTVVAAPTAKQELQELYARYKSLALSTSATLMLGGALEPLGDSLEELLGDCRAAQERGAVYAGELARCTEAAASLRPLLGGDPTAGALERARASHLRLRRAVWGVIPCEYVPCCASGLGHDER